MLTRFIMVLISPYQIIKLSTWNIMVYVNYTSIYFLLKNLLLFREENVSNDYEKTFL